MAIKKLQDVKPDKPAVKRCWLYSPKCPKGKIVVGDEAIAAAKEDGWVDSPRKVKASGAAGAGGKGNGGGKTKASTNDNSQ